MKLECFTVDSKGPLDSLVILLHGYGSSGSNILSVGKMLSARLPNTAVVCPNAPNAFEHTPGVGYQWFSLIDRSEESYLTGVASCFGIISDFVEQQAARFSIPKNKITLSGFSQGCMLALHCGYRIPDLMCLVGLSGNFYHKQNADNEIKFKPPTLLVHGAADDVVPPACLNFSRDILRQLKVPVEAHMLDGLTHEIDDRCVDLYANFWERTSTKASN